MSRASSSNIKICSMKLQRRGPLDWWLIGSQNCQLQETNKLSKQARTLSVHISRWSRTQHLLFMSHWAVEKTSNQLNQQSIQQSGSANRAKLIKRATVFGTVLYCKGCMRYSLLKELQTQRLVKVGSTNRAEYSFSSSSELIFILDIWLFHSRTFCCQVYVICPPLGVMDLDA